MAEKKHIPVGPIADFPVGKFKIVDIGGREVGITQLKNGEFSRRAQCVSAQGCARFAKAR
jgi:hypothetical protein